MHAAIDDQKDAFNLTESLFPGVPESAVKARADALFEWFMRSERAAKVARREALTHMWETLSGEHEPRDLPAQFDEATKQNPLVLLEGLARRKRALKSDADPSRRAEEEETGSREVCRSAVGSHHQGQVAGGGVSVRCL